MRIGTSSLKNYTTDNESFMATEARPWYRVRDNRPTLGLLEAFPGLEWPTSGPMCELVSRFLKGRKPGFKFTRLVRPERE